MNKNIIIVIDIDNTTGETTEKKRIVGFNEKK